MCASGLQMHRSSQFGSWGSGDPEHATVIAGRIAPSPQHGWAPVLRFFGKPWRLPHIMKSYAKRKSHQSSHLLSVSDAAEYLGISPRSIRRHVSNGDLAHRRVGWLLKFDKSALDAFAVPMGGSRKGGKL
jgi:excisionase family DNA binding protein